MNEQVLIPPKRVLIEFSSSAKGEVQPMIRVEAEYPDDAIEMLDNVLSRLIPFGETFKYAVDKINRRQI